MAAAERARDGAGVLCHVAMHYEDDACYDHAMACVDAGRDRMIAELSEWSGMTAAQVVQFIGGLVGGARSGRTFDEHLEATHGLAHIRRLHAAEAAKGAT